MRRRLGAGIGTTAIGAVVLFAIVGHATTIGTASTTVGAGRASVARCDTDGITVTGLNETAAYCGGKAIRVTLTGPGASNASLGEQTATLPTGAGTTQAFTFGGVSAASVTGAHVVISG